MESSIIEYVDNDWIWIKYCFCSSKSKISVMENFRNKRLCVLISIKRYTLQIVFLQPSKTPPVSPPNRYLSGKRGNCPFFGAVCSKNFVKRGV